ncbi:MAG: hypothetical protein V1875_02685 [Candidatus Altiarchaeota archaeon]
MDTRLSAAIAIMFLLTAPACADLGGLQPFVFSAAKFIVLSEKTGEEKFRVNETLKETLKQTLKFQTQKRKAAQYSPLAWYMPESWVPAAASAIGVFLISLTHMSMSLGQAVVESLIADQKKKKITVKKTALKVGLIKVREALSVIAAAVVLGAAISWTYAGPTYEFIWLMVLSTVVCLIAGISHEAVHRIAGKALGISAEYTFWFTGSFLTIVTALLGNAFGLQGMLVEQIKGDVSPRRLGLMKLAGPVFSIVVMGFFVGLNFVRPSVIFQIAFSISGMIAMAEILPFKPMDGYDVRKWSFLIWLLSFIVIGLMFSLVNFILMV